MDKRLAFFFVGCCMLAVTVAVDLGGECTDTNTCTTDGSECKKYDASCDKGTCTCVAGKIMYTDTANNNAKSCKTKIAYNAACKDDMSTGMCDAGLMCTADVCKCSTTGTDYKSALGMCTNKKVFGEVCASAADCYATDGVSCTTKTGESDKTCHCMDNYKQENQMCTKPKFGESCGASVGCKKVIGFSDVLVPTCSGDGNDKTCKCASADQQFQIKYMSMTKTFCATDAAGSKAVGATCTKMTECESNICMPDLCSPNINKCKQAETNGSRGLTASFVVLALSIFLAAL